MSFRVMLCHVNSNAHANNIVTVLVNVDVNVNANINVRIPKRSTNANGVKLLSACATARTARTLHSTTLMLLT